MITGFHKNIILYIIGHHGEDRRDSEELLMRCRDLTEEDKRDILQMLKERKSRSLAAS